MDAEKYVLFSKQQKANGFRLFAENRAQIAAFPPGARALDIGCGTGNVTELLSFFTNLGEIVGVDSMPEMIELAKKRNQDPRITYQQGSVMNANEFPPGKFHLITACAMMHWLPDQVLGLKNVFDSLENGGIFLAHIFGGSEAEVYLDDLLRDPEWFPYVNKEYFQTVEQIHRQPWMGLENPAEFYANYLRNAGFEILECETKIILNFLNDHELHGYVEIMLGKAVSGLSAEQKNRFLQHGIDGFKKKMRTHCDGKFWEHSTKRIWVCARKPRK